MSSSDKMNWRTSAVAAFGGLDSKLTNFKDQGHLLHSERSPGE